MKSSKYNIYLSANERFYVFNQLSSDLREIDSELNEVLIRGEIEKIKDSDLLIDLQNSHLICEDDLQEEYLILCANKTFRFSNNTARITLMPTLDCNFRCWYCYETHIEGYMSPDSIQSVIAFCKNLIDCRGIKSFILDWFGGEPLLHFDDVVYPISIAIKEYCEAKDVNFTNSITTNGLCITEEAISQMNKIALRSFQITLDGAKEFHDRTRFSRDRVGSYDRIVENIALLCRGITDVMMTVRINYTPANLQTIDSIAVSFPEDIRHKIFIEPQLVWQFKDNINAITDVIANKMEVFHSLGYQTRANSLPTVCSWCYAENMNQYVINYDLNVYKCTARDFKVERHSVGVISTEGIFQPNQNYYKYFVASNFENETCLSCEMLPSCTGMCIQKKVEGSQMRCPKRNIQESVIRQLRSYIDSVESKG